MTALPRLLKLSELAREIGVPVGTLRRHALQRDLTNFPLPVPGTGNRFLPEAIAAWMREMSGLPSATPAPQPDTAANDDSIAAWQKTLDERARGMKA